MWEVIELAEHQIALVNIRWLVTADYRGDTSLASKPARQQWETAFVNSYVAPVLNVC